MISIVMAYHNRKEQLLRTLHSISKSEVKSLEIIIVDDCSTEDQRIFDLPNLFDLDIKIVEIKETQKWWSNCCVVFNMGFKYANGNTILIQSPECIHVGDVLSYTKAHINSKKYICFSCYAIVEKNMDQLRSVSFQKESLGQLKQSLIDACGGMANINKQRFFNDNLWYCHPEFRSWSPHFTAAIDRNVLLKEFGGFDERYARGCDYDDTEFFHRIKKSNLKLIVPNPENNPFVIHQFHLGTNMVHNKSKEKINSVIYKEKTLKEKGWKVN